MYGGVYGGYNPPPLQHSPPPLRELLQCVWKKLAFGEEAGFAGAGIVSIFHIMVLGFVTKVLIVLRMWRSKARCSNTCMAYCRAEVKMCGCPLVWQGDGLEGSLNKYSMRGTFNWPPHLCLPPHVTYLCPFCTAQVRRRRGIVCILRPTGCVVFHDGAEGTVPARDSDGVVEADRNIGQRGWKKLCGV